MNVSKLHCMEKKKKTEQVSRPSPYTTFLRSYKISCRKSSALFKITTLWRNGYDTRMRTDSTKVAQGENFHVECDSSDAIR